MSSSNEVKWLWRLTSTEAFNEPYTTCYRLALGTSRPLLEADFDLALRHLFRKVPSLRVCLGQRDGDRWLREMDHEAIDLEMFSGGKTLEILTRMQRYKFDKDTGPLWCVKVKPGEMEPVAEFTYVYDMFLAINHIITDGISNMKICGFFVQLLDAVIAGTPVDDTQQLGVFISDEKTQALIQEHAAALEADPQMSSRLKAECEAIHTKLSLFKSTFKGQKDEEARTGMIWRDFERNASSSFIQRCRAEGVTVNSAFTALANIAMAELLAEGGLLQESYEIRSVHSTDGRKFWAGDTSQILGCHIIPSLYIKVDTPRSAKQTLWTYAKAINEEIHNKLKSGRQLQEKILRQEMPHCITYNLDYVISNLGDVTPLLTKGGRNVQILHLLRSVQQHNVPTTMSQTIHTYRGLFNYVLMYNTSSVTPTTAERYVSLLFSILDTVLQK